MRDRDLVRMAFGNTPQRLQRVADFEVKVRLGVHEGEPWPFLEFTDAVIMDEAMMEQVLDRLAFAIDMMEGVADPAELGVKVTQFLQDMLLQYRVTFEGEDEAVREVDIMDIDTGESVNMDMD